MDIKQQFTCKTCMVESTHSYQETPQCCGIAKVSGAMIWPQQDRGSTKLHMIKLLKDPKVSWQLPETPKAIFEIWLLRGGRDKGEKIGVVGFRQTTVEWVMPTGVAIRGGFSDTAEMAVASMMEALEGGVFAHQNIHAQVVS